VKSSSGGGGPSMGRREGGSESEVTSQKDVYLPIREAKHTRDQSRDGVTIESGPYYSRAASPTPTTDTRLIISII